MYNQNSTWHSGKEVCERPKKILCFSEYFYYCSKKQQRRSQRYSQKGWESQSCTALLPGHEKIVSCTFCPTALASVVSLLKTLQPDDHGRAQRGVCLPGLRWPGLNQTWVILNPALWAGRLYSLNREKDNTPHSQGLDVCWCNRHQLVARHWGTTIVTSRWLSRTARGNTCPPVRKQLTLRTSSLVCPLSAGWLCNAAPWSGKHSPSIWKNWLCRKHNGALKLPRNQQTSVASSRLVGVLAQLPLLMKISRTASAWRGKLNHLKSHTARSLEL